MRVATDQADREEDSMKWAKLFQQAGGYRAVAGVDNPLRTDAEGLGGAGSNGLQAATPAKPPRFGGRHLFCQPFLATGDVPAGAGDAGDVHCPRRPTIWWLSPFWNIWAIMLSLETTPDPAACQAEAGEGHGGSGWFRDGGDGKRQALVA
jgi:hypothetical protein